MGCRWDGGREDGMGVGREGGIGVGRGRGGGMEPRHPRPSFICFERAWYAITRDPRHDLDTT